MTRKPTHDETAEQAVIGAVLLAPHTMTELTAALSPTDFYRPGHSILWESLCTMHAAGTPTDPITMTAHLAEMGLLSKVGGAPYLHTLMEAVPAVGNAAHYARIVAEAARRRDLGDLGHRLTRLATSGGDVTEALTAGRSMLQASEDGGGWPP